MCFSLYWYFEMTDFVLVGEAGVELKPKILPIFPMLLAMTPLTFA